MKCCSCSVSEEFLIFPIASLNADFILPAMLLVVQFIILVPTVVVWILVHTDFQESKFGM